MVITERGCAKQVYQYQALERGKWKTITTIMEETYTSGCLKDSDWAEHLATDTEYCYCDQARCNDDRLLEQGEQGLQIELGSYLDWQPGITFQVFRKVQDNALYFSDRPEKKVLFAKI